jgi:putative spermidine/putrescine transport system ATP-binding protein
MSQVELVNVKKIFGDHTAVNQINLTINEGELVSLLGPSGCGKSTTLRMLAGFITPEEGDILMDGNKVTNVPANKRDTALVFQNYALFPHMTIFENVAFGLKMRKVPKAEIKEKVEKALETVDLGSFGKRYPKQLSGGQQQRVALARALIVNPKLLLLDEPLSNLDAKLREKMRVEIRQLQKKLGITTVFVTHDQEEALVLSDRIVVMEAGQIRQIGTPQDVFDKPESHFVADFVGIRNFFKGKMEGHTFYTEKGLEIKTNLEDHDVYEIAIRSNMIQVNPHNLSEFDNCYKAKIDLVIYRGTVVELTVTLQSGDSLTIEIPAEQYKGFTANVGSEIDLCWKADRVLVMN